MLTTFSTLALLLVLAADVLGQQEQCRYQTVSGQQRSIDYTTYYLEQFQRYGEFLNAETSFLREIYINSARSMILVCPDFHQQIKNNEYPAEEFLEEMGVIGGVLSELIRHSTRIKNF